MTEPNPEETEVNIDHLIGIETTDLPNVKNLSGCPKCDEKGNYTLKRKYCDDWCYDDGEEHMHVTCDKCGYSRGAQCADAVTNGSSCKKDPTNLGADNIKTVEPKAATATN